MGRKDGDAGSATAATAAAAERGGTRRSAAKRAPKRKDAAAAARVMEEGAGADADAGAGAGAGIGRKVKDAAEAARSAASAVSRYVQGWSAEKAAADVGTAWDRMFAAGFMLRVDLRLVMSCIIVLYIGAKLYTFETHPTDIIHSASQPQALLGSAHVQIPAAHASYGANSATPGSQSASVQAAPQDMTMQQQSMPNAAAGFSDVLRARTENAAGSNPTAYNPGESVAAPATAPDASQSSAVGDSVQIPTVVSSSPADASQSTEKVELASSIANANNAPGAAPAEQHAESPALVDSAPSPQAAQASELSAAGSTTTHQSQTSATGAIEPSAQSGTTEAHSEPNSQRASGDNVLSNQADASGSLVGDHVPPQIVGVDSASLQSSISSNVNVGAASSASSESSTISIIMSSEAAGAAATDARATDAAVSNAAATDAAATDAAATDAALPASRDATAVPVNLVEAHSAVGYKNAAEIAVNVDDGLDSMKFYGQKGDHLQPDRVLYRTFFRNPEPLRNGVFIEVGAVDGLDRSNTFFFEETLGWTGLLIDGQPDNAEALKESVAKMRSKSTAVPLAVCKPSPNADVSAGEAKLRMVGERGSAATVEYMKADHVANYGPKWLKKNSEPYEVDCASMDAILSKANIERVDLLVLDMNGAEVLALETFPFKRVKPDVILIDINSASVEHRGIIREIFRDEAYCFVVKVGSNQFFVNSNSKYAAACPVQP